MCRSLLPAAQIWNHFTLFYKCFILKKKNHPGVRVGVGDPKFWANDKKEEKIYEAAITMITSKWIDKW